MDKQQIVNLLGVPYFGDSAFIILILIVFARTENIMTIRKVGKIVSAALQNDSHALMTYLGAKDLGGPISQGCAGSGRKKGNREAY